MKSKSDKKAQAVPDAAREATKRHIRHFLNDCEAGQVPAQVASRLKVPLDLVVEVMSEPRADTCENCGKPADTWDNLDEMIPLCSGCKVALEKEELSRTAEEKLQLLAETAAHASEKTIATLKQRKAMVEDDRKRVREYVNAHPGMGALEIQAAADELNVHTTLFREVMSDLIVEGMNRSPVPTMPPLKDKPIEVSFTPAVPKNDPLMHESTDATMERLKQVSDKPVEKYLKSRKPLSTREALGVVDPHHPRDPSEYEWVQVDWNLEACYAGWGVMGIRVMGKRQMSLFIPLAAVHRAIEICPDGYTYRGHETPEEAPESDAREPLSFYKDDPNVTFDKKPDFKMSLDEIANRLGLRR